MNPYEPVRIVEPAQILEPLPKEPKEQPGDVLFAVAIIVFTGGVLGSSVVLLIRIFAGLYYG